MRYLEIMFENVWVACRSHVSWNIENPMAFILQVTHEYFDMLGEGQTWVILDPLLGLFSVVDEAILNVSADVHCHN